MPILANSNTYLFNLKKLKTYGLITLSLVITLNLPAQDSAWQNTVASCLANIPESTAAQVDQSTMLTTIQACQSCCHTGATAQNVIAMALFGCLEGCCSQIQDRNQADVTNRNSCCINLLHENGDLNSPTALLAALEQTGYKISGPDSIVPTLLQGCMGT